MFFGFRCSYNLFGACSWPNLVNCLPTHQPAPVASFRPGHQLRCLDRIDGEVCTFEERTSDKIFTMLRVACGKCMKVLVASWTIAHTRACGRAVLKVTSAPRPRIKWTATMSTCIHTPQPYGVLRTSMARTWPGSVVQGSVGQLYKFLCLPRIV